MLLSQSLPLLEPGRPQTSAFSRASPSSFHSALPLKIERGGPAKRPATSSGAIGGAGAGGPGGTGSLSSSLSSNRSAKSEARRLSKSASGPINIQQRAHGSTSYFQRPFDVAYSEVAMQRNLRKISNLFYEADEDKSGKLDLAEFQRALKHPQMMHSFAMVGIQPHQANVVFEAFDTDRDQLLSLEEFMTGLSCITQTNTDGTGADLDINNLKAANRRKVLEDGRNRLLATLSQGGVPGSAGGGGSRPGTAPVDAPTSPDQTFVGQSPSRGSGLAPPATPGGGGVSLKLSLRSALGETGPMSPSGSIAQGSFAVTTPSPSKARAASMNSAPSTIRFLGLAKAKALFPAHVATPSSRSGTPMAAGGGGQML